MYWFTGNVVRSVFIRGGVFAHEDYWAVPDVDYAHVSLRCDSGVLGVTELGRDAIYGYDICTEVVGDKGALQLVNMQGTGTVLLWHGQIVSDTYRDYRERFAQAYLSELQDFVVRVRTGRSLIVGSLEGVYASAVAEAAACLGVSGREEPVEIGLRFQNH